MEDNVHLHTPPSYAGKRILDMRVLSTRHEGAMTMLDLEPVGYGRLPSIDPGQFVQVRIDGSKSTYLRRPISVCDVGSDGRRLSLLVRRAGAGTDALCDSRPGQVINMVLPLGNGFPMAGTAGKRVLLIGGGVGVAPLLYYGKWLKAHGAHPVFVLGARSAGQLALAGEFAAVAPTCISTDDGSLGVHGVVTDNPATDAPADMWCVCGPAPMMKAVAAKARSKGVECHVSLENMMACGLGACLCCVEKTVHGNVCVCTYGPVFNINDLTWQ